MTWWSLRRRVRNAVGGRGWLEGTLTALGLVFLAAAAILAGAFVVVVLGFNDPDTDFPAGRGFVQGIKGFALVFLPVAAAVAFFVGRHLAGPSLARLVRRPRRPRS